MTTLTTRPTFLTPENGARFGDPTVADAYPLRPPYACDIFPVILNLMTGTPRALLDLGTGTGELARALAPEVARVDAVDLSAAMIAKGRTMPGGDATNLRWIEGRAEEVPLEPPYALATAGDSLHWTDWGSLLPRLSRLLVTGGVLALVHREQTPPPWQDGLRALLEAHATFRYSHTYDLITLLEERGLFVRIGRHEAAPILARQPVDEYLESFHSRSAFSRAVMSTESADTFDRGLRELVAPWSEGGAVPVQTVSSVEWGKPLGGSS